VVQISEFALQIGLTHVAVGETWRVHASLKYTAPESITVILQAAPYTKVLEIVNRVNSCIGQTQVKLDPAYTPTLKEATVDIYFLPEAQGGIADGTYGLIAEVLGTKVFQAVDNCLIVSGNPAAAPGIGDWLPMLMVVMMMGMVMPMMEET